MQRFVTAKLPTRRYELLWTLMDETLKDAVAGRGNLRVGH
jgi:hypothetical protein